MINIWDPKVWKMAIGEVRGRGYVCHTCGKPLLNFSSKVRSEAEIEIKGHCESMKHPAQLYIVREIEEQALLVAGASIADGASTEGITGISSESFTAIPAESPGNASSGSQPTPPSARA